MRDKIDLSSQIVLNNVLQSHGFIPWEEMEMVGIYRRLTISYDSLIGEVYRYHSDDYVIWSYPYPVQFSVIRSICLRKKDTFIHRFIFLHPTERFFCKKKSLLFGLKGFIYFIMCTYPISEEVSTYPEINDLGMVLRSLHYKT